NLEVVERKDLPEDGVVNALCPIGDNFVEPLQPTDPQGILAKYIDRWGEGIYHISMVVDDIDRQASELEGKGARVIVQEANADLSTKRAWLHPKAGHGLMLEMIPEELLGDLRGKPSHARMGDTEVVKFSHAHHVVRSLDRTLEMYDRLLGLRPIIRHATPGHGVNNAIVPVGDNFIELLEPTDAQGLTARFLERKGEGLRSVCFTVRNVEAAARFLESKGIEFVRHNMHPTIELPALWLRTKYTLGLLVEICPYDVIDRFYRAS
ncbi:MAG: VOC family protein, partial [Dehalococcoidia bacterium]